jgi:hypothetical protein
VMTCSDALQFFGSTGDIKQSIVVK